MTNFSYWKGS